MRLRESSGSTGALAVPSNADLVAGAQRGEEAAFAALFKAYNRRIYSVCLRMTRSAAEAEDLTQEAFLKLFRKISTFRGESTFATWLHRLAVNETLMHLRKQRLDTVSLDGVNARHEGRAKWEYGNDDLQLRGAVDRITLEKTVAELPPGFRTAFVLYDLSGYQHSEIARIMNCSVGNSKSQLHKARRKLRQLLKVKVRSQKSGVAAGPVKL
jgi:RNA polymerase sigma-70 factor, ECF subfamily